MRFGGRRPSPLAPDPDLIRTLAELLAENGLTEIEYAVGDRLIRVSRGAPAAAAVAARLRLRLPRLRFRGPARADPSSTPAR